MIRKLLILLLLFAALCIAQEKYFPEHVFYEDKSDIKTGNDLSNGIDKWYSEQLRAMNEPSLFELSKDKRVESYRFTWLRSFNHPMAIRLMIQQNGSGILYITENDGAGGGDP